MARRGPDVAVSIDFSPRRSFALEMAGDGGNDELRVVRREFIAAKAVGNKRLL